MRRTHAIVAFVLASIALVLYSRRPGAPFDWTEALGFTTGVLCVWMTAVEDVWNFPIGIVNSAFYIVVYYRAALYADFGLFVLYVFLGFHGWYLWLYGARRRTTGPNPEEPVVYPRPEEEATSTTELHVARADRTDLLNSVAVVAAGLPLWALLRHVNGFAPFMDALLTVMSIVAQLMLNRKRLENWIVWIVADVLYVGLYAYKGLYLTSILYVIYCGLAIGGYLQWRRALPVRGVVAA